MMNISDFFKIRSTLVFILFLVLKWPVYFFSVLKMYAEDFNCKHISGKDEKFENCRPVILFSSHQQFVSVS